MYHIGSDTQLPTHPVGTRHILRPDHCARRDSTQLNSTQLAVDSRVISGDPVTILTLPFSRLI